jgi:hypothetical protein
MPMAAAEALAFLRSSHTRVKLLRREEPVDVLSRNAMGTVVMAELVERFVTDSSDGNR